MRWFHLQRPICGDGCFLHHRVINYCSFLIIDLLIYWFPLLLLSSNSLQPINVTVTVGAYSLIVPDPNEQYIPALSMKPHENFNTSGFLNDDIGLIQVLLKLKLCTPLIIFYLNFDWLFWWVDSIIDSSIIRLQLGRPVVLDALNVWFLRYDDVADEDKTAIVMGWGATNVRLFILSFICASRSIANCQLIHFLHWLIMIW